MSNVFCAASADYTASHETTPLYTVGETIGLLSNGSHIPHIGKKENLFLFLFRNIPLPPRHHARDVI